MTECLRVEALPNVVVFRVHDGKHIRCDVRWNMAPFAPLRAHSVCLFPGRRIACYDRVVCNADIWIILLMQRLYVVHTIAIENVELQDKTSVVRMPRSRDLP